MKAEHLPVGFLPRMSPLELGNALGVDCSFMLTLSHSIPCFWRAVDANGRLDTAACLKWLRSNNFDLDSLLIRRANRLNPRAYKDD